MPNIEPPIIVCPMIQKLPDDRPPSTEPPVTNRMSFCKAFLVMSLGFTGGLARAQEANAGKPSSSADDGTRKAVLVELFTSQG